MTLKLISTGLEMNGHLTRDGRGLLRLSVSRRSYRADFDLAYLLTAGWEIRATTTGERHELQTSGLWRQMVH